MENFIEFLNFNQLKLYEFFATIEIKNNEFILKNFFVKINENPNLVLNLKNDKIKYFNNEDYLLKFDNIDELDTSIIKKEVEKFLQK